MRSSLFFEYYTYVEHGTRASLVISEILKLERGWRDGELVYVLKSIVDPPPIESPPSDRSNVFSSKSSIGRM